MLPLERAMNNRPPMKYVVVTGGKVAFLRARVRVNSNSQILNDATQSGIHCVEGYVLSPANSQGFDVFPSPLLDSTLEQVW